MTVYKYWLGTDISVGSNGKFFRESPKIGVQALITIHNHVQGPRIILRAGEIPISAKTIMAEAFLGRRLLPTESARFIKGQALRPDNILILKSFNAPMTCYPPDGDPISFQSITEAAEYLARATGFPEKGLRYGVRNVLAGSQQSVKGHYILLDEDIDPTKPDPWNFRPIDQLNYKGEVMQSFDSLQEVITGLELPPKIGPTSIYRRLRGVLGGNSRDNLRILGFKIAYRSVHTRRMLLSSKL